jgi:uncharacterized protein (DUF433 family)
MAGGHAVKPGRMLPLCGGEASGNGCEIHLNCYNSFGSIKGRGLMTLVTEGHILLDDKGEAWIDDTNVKVIEVVLDKLAHGSTAEEMHVQFPHLSVARIYAALAYYHDHKQQMDARIEQDGREVGSLRAQAGETPGRAKLRVAGLRP